MKNLLIVYLLLLSVISTAQRITRSEVNGFTDERTIQTSIVSLKQGFSTGYGIQYTAVNRVYYISFIGYGKKSTVIKDEDRVHFLLNDGTVIKFNSRVELPSGEASRPNLYIHHYYIDLKDIEALKRNKISIVRVISPNVQADTLVSKKNSSELSKLSEIFLKEVSKLSNM
jgi:putative component of toxin-antitoxin plasmid stabilization module